MHLRYAALEVAVLYSLVQKGKKFRLPCSAEKLFEELQEALTSYIAWAMKGNEDPHREQKLEDWADAVLTQTRANWEAAELQRDARQMDGFPGLRSAIQEAKQHLVFLSGDRAPHGIFVICKRWYQQQMARYLTDTEVFEDVPTSWASVCDGLKEKLSHFGFKAGKGVIYNYGIWKPVKQKFRFIAGTRKDQDVRDNEENQRSVRGPPRCPTYYLAKCMVGALKAVVSSLKQLDIHRQQTTGLRCFWSIDSINEFSRYVRVNASKIVAGSMATYDFTTMYTMLPFDTIVTNTMEAVKEAHEYEASKALPGQGEPKLSGDGWTWDGEGWSLPRFEEILRILINAAYTMNGGLVRRQIKGLPMGLACAPQLATLSCYPIEKKYVLETKPTGVITRFIDDFWTDMSPPPASDHGMEYKKTSEKPKQVV